MNINAMVATRVMGWTPDELGCYATDTHPSHGGRVRWCVEDSDALDSLNDAEVWSPSTDPAAMMVVVEKMREQRFSATITVSRGGTAEIAACQFVGDSRGFGAGNTMMLAVSLAALRAVGTPEDEITKALEER